LCTTREKKYAVRKQERVCPECGKPAVIKGKAEYGGGWLCFKKKDGCGAKWSDGNPAIEGQSVGEVENPDLPDLWNTVVKMAEKRARVDAVLAVTGASALFTQDVEDTPAPEPTPAPVPTPPPSAPVEDESKALYYLLAADGPLHAKQVEANKSMEMIGCGVGQRLRELRLNASEDALDGLIARCHAAADHAAAKS
jgi:hypothetical protein